MDVKRIAPVTVPALSFKSRTRAYVRIESEMHESGAVGQEDDGREPAVICRVTDLEDGQLYELICPTLLVTALDRYPGGYKGLCFEIDVSAAAKPGKRYKEVTVYEIEDPKPRPQASSGAPASAPAVAPSTSEGSGDGSAPVAPAAPAAPAAGGDPRSPQSPAPRRTTRDRLRARGLA